MIISISITFHFLTCLKGLKTSALSLKYLLLIHCSVLRNNLMIHSVLKSIIWFNWNLLFLNKNFSSYFWGLYTMIKYSLILWLLLWKNSSSKDGSKRKDLMLYLVAPIILDRSSDSHGSTYNQNLSHYFLTLWINK